MHLGNCGSHMNGKFWKDKRVLITGHTGFKGSWLTYLLSDLGAIVFGVSNSDMGPLSLYNVLDCRAKLVNHQLKLLEFYDIRDLDSLSEIVGNFEPEIAFHLAAQPLVVSAYKDPLSTYSTNVLGTINLLESLKRNATIRSVISVTTDKVYRNHNDDFSYTESDALGGYDPYSASKACADLITQSYYNSYLQERGVGVSCVRAGNVIGGGDWSENRLIPDIIRSIMAGSKLFLRNADATRPWQHVLDPLAGYMLLAEKLYENPTQFSLPVNFGPIVSEVLSVREVVEKTLSFFDTDYDYECTTEEFYESKKLSLDCTRAHLLLDWVPVWSADEAIKRTAEWYKSYIERQDLHEITSAQINDYRSKMSFGKEN